MLKQLEDIYDILRGQSGYLERIADRLDNGIDADVSGSVSVEPGILPLDVIVII